jgi:hypothetical protein
MDARRRLAALIPLQMVIVMIALRHIGSPERVPQIAGWLLLAGALMTIGAYAIAWRRQARPAND